MSRAQQIEALLTAYQQKRMRAQREAEARVEEARSRDPEIGRLQEGMALRFAEATRRVMSDRAGSREIVERLKKETLADQKEIEARLETLGLPADYFKVRYECPICEDTGYAGEHRDRYCVCFERALDISSGRGTQSGHTFERYNPDIFPDEIQKARTAQAKMRLQRYADRFPYAEKRNILITGECGLGKTFLLDAVANRVQDRGFSVLRLTAFQMLEIMRAYHLGEDTEGAFRNMLNCPLLLVDDLGTEPMMRNITRDYLFLLLNEREDRHTAFATNLELSQIVDRYGERIFSRMVDRSRTEAIQLTGQDLRLRGNRG